MLACRSRREHRVISVFLTGWYSVSQTLQGTPTVSAASRTANRRKRGPLFWFCVVLLGVPAGSFVLLSLSLMIYIYWPMSLDEAVFPDVDPGVEHIVVISHGLRDTAETWSDKLAATLSTDNGKVQIISLDWNPYAQNTLRCSVDGKRLGESLGNHLAASSNLQSLHLIAHSCGAFVSLGICESLREHRSNVAVQSTYLDPVTVYGGLFWDFGLERFGTCADFSDAYIDTGDDVPGSNQLLPATHTFDVTAARSLASFDGPPHVWPTVYYRQLAQAGMAPDLRSDPNVITTYPRNVLEVLRR